MTQNKSWQEDVTMQQKSYVIVSAVPVFMCFMWVSHRVWMNRLHICGNTSPSVDHCYYSYLWQLFLCKSCPSWLHSYHICVSTRLKSHPFFPLMALDLMLEQNSQFRNWLHDTGCYSGHNIKIIQINIITEVVHSGI